MAGAVLGIPLGVLVARVGLPFLATTTALASNLPVPAAKLGLTLPDILLGLGLGIGAAVAAAMVPALRMSRTNPVAALTMRGWEMPSVVPSPKWRTPAVIGVFDRRPDRDATCVGHENARPAYDRTYRARRWLPCDPIRRLWKPRSKAPVELLVRTRGTNDDPDTLYVSPDVQRSLSATLGIGLGSVLMLATLGWSFERSLVASLARRYTAQLMVMSPFAAGGHSSAPLSSSLVARSRRYPGSRRQLESTFGSFAMATIRSS